MRGILAKSGRGTKIFICDPTSVSGLLVCMLGTLIYCSCE